MNNPPVVISASKHRLLAMKLAYCFLLFLGGILISGCHHEKPDPEAAAPNVEGDTVTFETNAPQLGSLTVQPAKNRTLAVQHLTGHLYWDDDVTVRIFTPLAGRVVKVSATSGQSVTPETTLAEIDSPDFGQALANVRAAAGNLAAAEKSFARNQDLLQHGAAAQKDVETAEAAYIAAQAERDRANAVLANYGSSDKSTNSIYLLKSPLAGVLVEKNINPGQEVRADQMLANATQLYAPLFVVSDPTKLWLQLDVSELDLASLKVGQPLRVHSSAFPGQEFSGEIENIGASLDPTTRTIKVRGVVHNPDNLLKAEMYVLADVLLDDARNDQTSVDIPAKAVFMEDDKYYVFIQQSAGKFQRQLVKVGEEQDGQVAVLRGVSAGQNVVTDGCLLLESILESTDKS